VGDRAGGWVILAKTYDVIVVGAGSAGCALTHRLVNAGVRVLLLEAGGPDDKPQIHSEQLLDTLSLWAPGELDWGYVSEPQRGMGGRTIAVMRGKVWGGCSSVNAMVHVRGNRRDYDRWAAAGNPGWAYADVLPLFRRMEDFDGGASDYRGSGGPLSVIVHDTPTPVSERLFPAAAANGFDDLGSGFDYNAERQEGAVFYYQATKTRHHRRASTAEAYLRPILDSPQLALESYAVVSRVLIEAGRAVGVEYMQDGHAARARADHEVVICAGTFESPKLLMLSGVGGAAELGEHGLKVLVDAPAVGKGLQDHLILGVGYMNRQPQPELPTLIAETGLFLRTAGAAADGPPDIQIKFGGLKFVPPDKDRDGPGFTFAPVLIQPRSSGAIRLRSADPSVTALLDPDYLSAQADVDALVAAVELVRELAHDRALDDFRGEELAPGASVTGRQALADYVRAYSGTLWHPTGTCRMAPGPDGVVDAQLRVKGVARLRVADASIMPLIVAGNTNAATIMIGERAADLVTAALGAA
jgi:choline dehydrogenase